MKIYGIGLVGYGGFGQFLHGTYDGLPNARVTAIADERMPEVPGDVEVFASASELFATPEVEVVVIATPPGSHGDLGCAAMEAGKHVLIEKPLALSREEARRLIATRDRTGVVATVDFMLRFNPVVEAVQEWCRSGAFGALRRVLVENYAQDEALPRTHWFWDAAQSGGILVEHAVHFIDIVHGCTDAGPARIEGFQVARASGQIDRVGLQVLYDDGLMMSQYHAFSRPGFFEHTSMRFVFDLLQLEVVGWIPLEGRFRALLNPSSEAALYDLTGIQLTAREAIQAVQDEQRLQGEGETGAMQIPVVRSGGVTYDVAHMVEGTFSLPQPKSVAYAEALQALMADLLQAIEQPGHQMRVTLEDGLSSLEVALAGTDRAAWQETKKSR